jgi:hypothetical protein
VFLVGFHHSSNKISEFLTEAENVPQPTVNLRIGPNKAAFNVHWALPCQVSPHFLHVFGDNLQNRFLSTLKTCHLVRSGCA